MACLKEWESLDVMMDIFSKLYEEGWNKETSNSTYGSQSLLKGSTTQCVYVIISLYNNLLESLIDVTNRFKLIRKQKCEPYNSDTLWLKNVSDTQITLRLFIIKQLVFPKDTTNVLNNHISYNIRELMQKMHFNLSISEYNIKEMCKETKFKTQYHTRRLNDIICSLLQPIDKLIKAINVTITHFYNNGYLINDKLYNFTIEVNIQDVSIYRITKYTPTVSNKLLYSTKLKSNNTPKIYSIHHPQYRILKSPLTKV